MEWRIALQNKAVRDNSSYQQGSAFVISAHKLFSDNLIFVFPMKDTSQSLRASTIKQIKTPRSHTREQ